jgi:hypothetical protein
MSYSVPENLFTNLLPDLIRFLAIYLEPCDIVKFSHINIKINRNLKNDKFLILSGHKYLSIHDKRLPSTDKILREIVKINKIINFRTGDLTLSEDDFFIETNSDEDNKQYILVSIFQGGYEIPIKIYYKKRKINRSILRVIYPSFVYGYIDIIIWLLDNYGNLNNFQASLLAAAEHGTIDIIKYIFGNNKVSINHEMYVGAIKIASNYGNWDILEYLIDQGIDVNNQDILDYYLFEPEKIKYLITKGATIAVLNITSEEMSNILSNIKPRKGTLDLIKHLISMGYVLHCTNVKYIDILLRTTDGLAPLENIKYLWDIMPTIPKNLKKYNRNDIIEYLETKYPNMNILRLL